MAGMRKKLAGKFFDRPTLAVAGDLLGKFIVRRLPGGREISLMITETEAYDGFKDRASHARSGKTRRNTPMFGEPGRWYVYFTYGMHWMLNIVTREAGYPAAVLIRGGVASGRGGKAVHVNGPAKLTKFLKIDKRLSGLPAAGKTGLWVEDRGIRVPQNKISRGPRVGIGHAGERWAAKPWRFLLDIGLPDALGYIQFSENKKRKSDD